MNPFLSRDFIKKPLVKGTILLSVTGVISRFLGFFLRIFFSRIFGAESMGLYQLVLPILALVFAFTSSGIQTALSKLIAEHSTSKREQQKYLFTAIFLSTFLSILCGLFLYVFADWISLHLLNEVRTAPLLRISALSIPLASIHACVCGYFYGIKKAFVPAFSQLLEQVVRILSIYSVYLFLTSKGLETSINLAALGLVFGEASSMLFSILFYTLSQVKQDDASHFTVPNKAHFLPVVKVKAIRAIPRLKELINLSFPLCSTRICIHLLQSLEATALPACLLLYGVSHAKALELYGTLTGMSLPVILFPTVVTGSIAVLLLPVISEASSQGNFKKVEKAIRFSIRYSLLAGSLCTLLFCLSGKMIGLTLFKSELCGHYIQVLGFLCPFMYIAGTLSSIINGLGKTGTTFFISNVSMLVRIALVYYLIPDYGMEGYLWSILISQILQTILCMRYCKIYTKKVCRR